MLMRRETPIGETETVQSLHDRLRDMGAAMVVEALPLIAARRLTAEPQPAEGVTYAAKLTRADSAIDWTQPAHAIERQVRALNPWPGVSFMLGTMPMKLHAARVVSGTGAPGTVLDQAFTVACGEDALRLTRVQRPGKAPMEAAEFLRGFPLAAGTVLS
jgi:methionyl-tRNA formyltransferase